MLDQLETLILGALQSIYDQFGWGGVFSMMIFENATGIKVRLHESNDAAIVERLQREGKNSSADVLILVDAARLDQATEAGLFQPVRSAALMRDVPLSLRDPKGRWFGLTRRGAIGKRAGRQRRRSSPSPPRTRSVRPSYRAAAS